MLKKDSASLTTLKDQVRDFVREACEALSTISPHYRPWHKLVRKGTSWSMRTEMKPDFSEALIRFRISNRDSAPFRAIVETVRTDSELRACFLVDAAGEPVVGDEQEQWWLDNAFAGAFLHRYIADRDGLDFDESGFERVFEALRQDVISATVTITEISPLFNAEIASKEVEIERGLRLRRLADDDLEHWLNASTGLSPSQPLGMIDLLRLRCALESTHQEPRSNPLSGPRDSQARAVTALRLVTDGAQRIAFTVRRSSSTGASGLGTTWSTDSGSGMRPMARLSRAMEPKLAELYVRLKANPNQEKIDLALRRWDSATERRLPADQMIDYWIALESLFLPDLMGEMSMRAALRIATFLGTSGASREAIYRHVGESYDLRSEIVHGSVRKRKRKTADAELIELTRSYLRKALIKILGLEDPFDATDLEKGLWRR